MDAVKGSLHDYMRVGLVHFMAYPECMGGAGPILDSVERLAADTFFEVLEVTRITDADTRREVRRIADQSRVELCFGAQPVLLGGKLDLNHPDDAERQRAIGAVTACVDQAGELGARGLAVLSGKVSNDREAATARLVDSLGRLCAYGAARGVRIVLETFDQVPYGKNCLIGPTAAACEVSETLRQEWPDFGIMLDLSHLPLLGESCKDALTTAGGHLVHAHIGNCAMDDPAHEAYGDNHPRFGAPGTRNDTADLTEYLKYLLEIGYLDAENRGVVSFEVKPMRGERSDAVVAGAKRTLEAAWRRL